MTLERSSNLTDGVDGAQARCASVVVGQIFSRVGGLIATKDLARGEVILVIEGPTTSVRTRYTIQVSPERAEGAQHGLARSRSERRGGNNHRCHPGAREGGEALAADIGRAHRAEPIERAPEDPVTTPPRSPVFQAAFTASTSSAKPHSAKKRP